MLPVAAVAQTAAVKGRIVNARTRDPLVGAHVRLRSAADTSETSVTTTDDNGAFSFARVDYKTYSLEVSFIGYAKSTKVVHVDKSPLDLGTLTITESAVNLEGVLVEANPPPAVQKADTTEFNAGAFKTHPDATAEDLVTKMPGVIVNTNGTVTAQGENVQQVLVDGKPFFGNDPTLVMRNLPAEVIDKIQIFDKMSDQAEFTGFDDGQSIKTMNFITKQDRRNQPFGKIYAGYGDDQRYNAGGGMNNFGDDSKISVIGLANNVNQQNFSQQDLLGVLGNSNQQGFAQGGGAGGRRGSGRGGGGGGGGGGGNRGGGGGQGNAPGASNFLVGQQNGITTTNSVGENYTTKVGSDFVANQSYFLNYTDADNTQRLQRSYFGSADSLGNYNQDNQTGNRNYNNRIDGRLEYTMDSSNSAIDLPRLYFQNNKATSLLDASNIVPPNELVSVTDGTSQTNTDGYNLSDHLTLRHRFEERGRTISLDVGAGLSRRNGTSLLQTQDAYYQSAGTTFDTLDQRTPSLTKGYSLTSRIVYTEPMSANGLLQLSYIPSYQSNNSDSRKFQFDAVTGEYSIPQLSLSNTYQNSYWTQGGGVGFRYRNDDFNLMANLAYQVASLHGEQVYPVVASLNRVFYDVLPNALLTFNMADHTSLRISYVASTAPPSISQMQNVVNNSNPLLLTSGNPDLRQSVSQTVFVRYGHTRAESGRSLFLFCSVSTTNGYIANSTLTAQKDTVLYGGVTMNRGTQLTYPVNIDGYWSFRSFLTYGMTSELLKSNLNLISGVNYTKTPGLIDGTENLANVTALTGGAVLSSNINEDVDFTLSYTGNYNISKYSIEPGQNSNYFYHTASLKSNLIFLDGIVLRNELTNSLYTGLAGGYNQNIVLWNIGLGKKFLTNDRAELRLTVTDALNQNQSVSRSITETYVQDTQNEVLGRFYIVAFTYTVR